MLQAAIMSIVHCLSMSMPVHNCLCGCDHAVPYMRQYAPFAIFIPTPTCPHLQVCNFPLSRLTQVRTEGGQWVYMCLVLRVFVSKQKWG